MVHVGLAEMLHNNLFSRSTNIKKLRWSCHSHSRSTYKYRYGWVSLFLLHFSLLFLPPRIFWAARSCGPSCGPARMLVWRGLQTVWIRRGPLRETGSSFEAQPLVRLDCCTAC